LVSNYKIKDFFNAPIKLDHFHINRLEEMPALPKSIVSPHKHKFIEIFLLLNGSMEHNIDFKQFVIKKPSLFFISEGQYHFWTKSNRVNLKGYRLMFEENFIQNVFLQQNFLFELVYLNNVYQNPLMTLSKSQQLRVVQLFDLLHQEFNRIDFNLKALQANLFLLLLEIQRESIAANSAIDNAYHVTTYQKFNKLVDSHFKENKSNSWYAQNLNISTAQLNRIVSKYSSSPVGQFIQNRRILEAKRLLVTTSKTIQTISYELGFHDYSYFIRVFKKYVKTTPQDFRSKM